MNNSIENAKKYFFEGINFLAKENFLEAERAFLNSLTLFPNRPSTLINLASTQIRLRKYQEAQINLENAAKIEGHSSEILINYALISFENQEFEGGISYLQQCLEIDASNLQALLLKAKIHIELNEFNEAINHLENLLKIDPNCFDALIELSAVFNELKQFARAKKICELAIRLNSNSSIAIINLGTALSGLTEHDSSLELYSKALELDPYDSDAWSNKGNTLYELKRFDQAIACYDKAISLKPDYPEAWSNKGNTLYELKRFDQAIACYDKAISLKPDYPEAWSNKGNTLYELKRFDQAIACYDKAISLKPDYPEAWSNKGNTLYELKRFDQAIACYDKAISLKPDYPEAWSNKGNTLYELKRFNQAIACYDKAISLKPDYFKAWSSKGAALHELKCYNDAITHHEKALILNPDYEDGWINKGAVMHELKRFDQAIACYDRAISLKPDYYRAWSSKGAALHELKCYNDAITHHEKALTLKLNYELGWANKGNTLNVLGRHAESARCYLKALELSSEDSYYLGQAHHQKMLICDWSDYESLVKEIFFKISINKKAAEPFGFQGISTSEELLKKCACDYSDNQYPILSNLSKSSRYDNGKIRIGYLCGEFREHATAVLMARVWELHDKSRFEIFAFDTDRGDNSDYRLRIERAFNNFFDISKLSDHEAANFIKQNNIHILINLNGFFGQARQGIFSYKPAPIQVNYLGFPGTIGGQYMDYIVADKIVIPEESKEHYVEKVVYLPNSYQANDDQRKTADKQFTRAELGHPADAFVFACFNNNYRITPNVFDSWMKILSSVRGSVLWLLTDSSAAKKNLIKESILRGMDPARLVFAERLPISDHLARHVHADLFLDTFPYNAHTTASDALWSGLPVLTFKGNTFPGRVAASLLMNIGLPELITESQEKYEMLAVELALDYKKLTDIKSRLLHNQMTAPLFNSPLFTKNLESAYVQMYARYQSELDPDHITIFK